MQPDEVYLVRVLGVGLGGAQVAQLCGELLVQALQDRNNTTALTFISVRGRLRRLLQESKQLRDLREQRRRLQELQLGDAGLRLGLQHLDGAAERVNLCV